MNKKRIFRYVALIILILETFSIIQGFVNVPNTLLMLGVIILGVIFYPKAFQNKITLYYAFFIFIFSLNLIVKDSFDTRWFLIVLLFWTFVLSIFNVFIYSRDFKGLKLISITGFLILITTSLINLPLLIQDPMYTRELMKKIGEGNDESAKLAKRLGIFSYGLVHILPSILPLIIYNVKENKLKVKFLWLVFLLILSYTILKISFGTVIILSAFIIPAAFLISQNRKKNILILFILGIFSAQLLNEDNIISYLDYVRPFFENTIVEGKIDDINSSFKYGMDGSIDFRKNLYEKSNNAFKKNPIFGTYNHSDVGEHSFIIDFLAWFGLAGTIPLLLCFIEVLKTNYKILPSKTRIYYLLSIVPFVFLSFLKGTPFFEQLLYLFIFIPGLFLTLYSKNKIIKLIQ